VFSYLGPWHLDEGVAVDAEGPDKSVVVVFVVVAVVVFVVVAVVVFVVVVVVNPDEFQKSHLLPFEACMNSLKHHSLQGSIQWKIKFKKNIRLQNIQILEKRLYYSPIRSFLGSLGQVGHSYPAD
jgi:hypothetical protein